MNFVKSEKLRETRPLLALEFRRTTSIAWILMTIFFFTSYKFGIESDQKIDLRIVLLIGFALSISLLLDAFSKSSYSYIPVIAAFTTWPFLLKIYAGVPWFSFGLIIVVASLSCTAFDSNLVAVAGITLLAVIQIFVAKQEFKFITDNKDNLLFYGSFSTIWILIISIGALITKQRFFQIYDEKALPEHKGLKDLKERKERQVLLVRQEHKANKVLPGQKAKLELLVQVAD